MIDIDTMTLLIVDDLKSARSIIKKTLRNLNIGKEIFLAEDGYQAIACLEEHPVDLAIVDWRMPGMNGAQLLEHIRNHKDLRDMLVLMVTAESQRDVVYEVAEIEVDGYLLKPLSPVVLDEKIRALVHKANHPDQGDLYIKKSREYEEAGKIELAIRCLEKAVDLRPNASRLKRNLGILYGKAGNASKMETCFLEAAAANLEDAVTRHRLCALYWQRKAWHQAVRYACEVVSLTNRFNEDLLKMGKRLLTMKENHLAVAVFSKILGKMETHLKLKEEVLDLCLETGEMKFAITLVEQMIKAFPSRHELLFKAGIAYEAMGDEARALDYFLAADKNQVNPVQTKLKIARIYARGDKILQADEYLGQVLKLAPENQEAIRIRQSL